MDPRLLATTTRSCATSARARRRVRARVSEDRLPAGHGGPGGRRPVCRAPDRRPRLPGGARRLKLDAEYPRFTRPPARHGLSALPRADAVDAGGADDARSRRRQPRQRLRRCRAAARCGRARRSGRTRTASSAPRSDVRAEADRGPAREYFSYAPDLPLAQHRAVARDPRRRAHRAARAGRADASTSIAARRAADPFRRRRRRGLAAARAACSASRSACWCGAVAADAASGAARGAVHRCRAASVQPVGFEDDEAMLPVTPRGFSGYRLLQEYFAFPQRFLFVAHRRPARSALDRSPVDRGRDRAAVLARRRRRSKSW